MSADVEAVELWDGRTWPGRVDSDGLLAFRFGWAPDGLLTRRQLRAAGLAPGGQEPYGRIVWKRERRFAWLYREDLAAPKRVPTPAQLAAVDAALAARKVCVECGPVDHTVRTTDHLCGDCYAATLADEVDQDAAEDGAIAELRARYRETPPTSDPFRTTSDADAGGDGATEHKAAAPADDRAQILAAWSGTEITDALERARRALDDLVSRQLRNSGNARSRNDEAADWTAADTAPVDETAEIDRHGDWRERGVA